MAALRGGTVTRLLAAVAATVAFAMWADVARAADPDEARVSWSPGPEVQIVEPRLVRLSADRILALRVEPRSCVHNVMGCRYPVYDKVPALVVDVRNGTSTPAAAPPDGWVLSSFPVGVDGDAYFPAGDPQDRQPARSLPDKALLRYVGADDRWEVLPLPDGVPSAFSLRSVGRRLVVLTFQP